MQAVVEIGGKQYLVQEGDILDVEKVSSEPGAVMTLDKVLLTTHEDDVAVGRPYVSGASVQAKIQEHILAPKVTTFKFKNKTNYHRTIGHRQPLTRVVVEKIVKGN